MVIYSPAAKGEEEHPSALADVIRSEGAVSPETARHSEARPLDDGVPVEVSLAGGCPVPVLALGSQSKNTVCLARGGKAWVSAVHGDLLESVNYRRFLDTIRQTVRDIGGQSVILAHDLHPSHWSTQYARSQGFPTIAIQHHHAHAISCMVDAGLPGPVLGVVCDGMGYGPDGAGWGGEVMLCDLNAFQRLARLDYFTLPRGGAAAKETWRPAMSVLRAAFPNTWSLLEIPSLRSVPARDRRQVTRQFDLGLDAFVTSSLGRLFDAVAALTGICLRNTFDGEAASKLQAAARTGEMGRLPVKAYPFELLPAPDGVARLDWRPTIRAIVDQVRGAVDAPRIAARFHATIIAMFTAAVEHAARVTRLRRVVLSGGCFQNDILRAGLGRELEGRGFWAAEHRRVSCGGPGVSLGQAAIAGALAIKNAR